MSRGLFVTGTDTDCGKTFVAAELIRRIRATGLRVAGFKPVAAGAGLSDGELRNDDALTLMEASGLALPHRAVNPYCLAPPVAPHIAAAEAGVEIRLQPVLDAYRQLLAFSDLVVVEGAGGWAVPLADGFDMADLALGLDLPVLLVVGLRLGCINHARLSEQAILAGGARLVGWVGSQVDPAMPRLGENLDTLGRLLSVPCLGVLTRAPSKSLEQALDIPRLLEALGG
ncbi:MAG: dethiobiotin synthase [Gammaproteobacteria bacterium]|nr:dethiobiotin synthase [Gammaproteobacteria bacterium]